jgi:hypothetical protein
MGAGVTGAEVTGAEVTGAEVTGAEVTGAEVTGAPEGAAVAGAADTGAADTGAAEAGAAEAGAAEAGAAEAGAAEAGAAEAGAAEAGAAEAGAIETGVVIPPGAVATGGSRVRVNAAETWVPPEQRRRRHENAVALTTSGPISNSGQTLPAHMAKGADESVKSLVEAPLWRENLTRRTPSGVTATTLNFGNLVTSMVAPSFRSASLAPVMVFTSWSPPIDLALGRKIEASSRSFCVARNSRSGSS